MTVTTTERLSASESGDRIWEALDGAAHLGMTKPQILAATGLTASQFQRGYDWIRDVFRHERQQPIVIGDGHRYVLTCYVEESADYIRWTLRGLHKRLTRADGTVNIHVIKFDPSNGPLVSKQMTRLVEDIGDVLALFGEAV